MNWTLYRTETFLATARKFFRRHPELKMEFADFLHQLEEDPHAPRLRLHPLRGWRKGTYAASLTYSFRVVLTLQLRGRKIVLLDICSHDEVYR
jgi:mRNA-degrading endonuclease YafQ of YafQ-DinJ toxin-antitoxin module